jgi:hypothetical protein
MRSSPFTVLRFIASSYLVGACTAGQAMQEIKSLDVPMIEVKGEPAE